MKNRIHWISEGEGSWVSSEERFHISPNFRHCVNPDSYTLTDYMSERAYLDHKAVWKFDSWTFDTVRECKAHAERQLKPLSYYK